MGLCIIGAKDIEEYQKRKDARLLDLRDPTEYRRFHIPGACNVPVEKLEAYMKDASKTQLYIFYCQHGSLSFQEGKRYVRAGYKICTLAGGMLAYCQTFGK